MNKHMYLFIPAKASEISEGDFYFIPLSDGSYACGRILAFQKKNGRKTQRVLVGLHDWSGKQHPTHSDIHESPIIEQGVMHINSINQVGGNIIGCKALEEDGLKPLLQFEAGCLLDGFENLGKLPTEDYKKYSRRATYGLDVIRILAEKNFVKNEET